MFRVFALFGDCGVCFVVCGFEFVFRGSVVFVFQFFLPTLANAFAFAERGWRNLRPSSGLTALSRNVLLQQQQQQQQQ